MTQTRAKFFLLIASVLIAHLALLNSGEALFDLSDRAVIQTFSTRVIEAQPPSPPAIKTITPRSLQRPLPPQPAKPESTSGTSPASAPTIDPAPRPAAAVAEVAPVSAPVTAPTPSAPSTPLLPLRIPPPHHLHYAVSGEARKLRYSASADLHWQHDGAQYAARLEVGAFLLGKRIQTSAGSLDETGLAPTRFSDKARSEVAAHFERDKGVVVFSANSPDAPLLAGAQDRLSVLLQLSALLAGAPERYPAGTQLSLQTVGPREAEIWQIEVVGEEALQLPVGMLSARKLLRRPQREFDLTVEIWFAPALNWLPVQLKLTQASGDFVELSLERHAALSEKP